MQEQNHGFLSISVGILALLNSLDLGDALVYNEKLGIGFTKILNVETLDIVPGIEGMLLILTHQPTGELEAGSLKQKVSPKFEDLNQTLEL